MFKDRIEIEGDESMSVRYEKLTLDRQRVFEFFWDLREAFGERLFGGITNATERLLASSNDKEIGRRRFFRVVGPIKIPLPPYSVY